MRKNRFLFFAFMTVASIAFAAFMPGGADWSKVRKLHGKFVIAIVNYAYDQKERSSTALLMNGFVAQGEFTAERVDSSAERILYVGKASGFLSMTHKSSASDTDVAKSEQVCAGDFNTGDVRIEIMPGANQYQVTFNGSLPAGKTLVSYPLFKEMERMFSKAYDLNRAKNADWAAEGQTYDGIRNECTGALKDVQTTEEVRFSATTISQASVTPDQASVVAKTFSLPENGTKIDGAGEIRLTVSTSLMPAVAQAASRWMIEAEE
ncbi:MAG TPA: hypothetical protein VLX91_00710 [Candidatus Acidoferrales bacterium]|nr:hypothetical protein [Candidatus Acidoferrales bacterium]